MKDSIEPFIHRKILVLKPDTPVKVAARAMCERQVGSAVVADHDGHCVGFITDRDITCRGVAFELSGTEPVSDLMSTDVQWVESTATMNEVMTLMKDAGIRRVPVIEPVHGGRQKCVGMVTLDDLIVSGAADVIQLREIIRAQIRQEAVRKPGLDNRSDEKKEQTYNKFIKHLADHMDLNTDTAEPVIMHALKLLVRRMPATSATNLISQLPSLFQDELFDLPAGPDKSITTMTFMKDFGRLIKDKDHDVIKDTICGFWRGLETYLGPDNLEFVVINLPLDFQALFGRISSQGRPAARLEADRAGSSQGK